MPWSMALLAKTENLSTRHSYDHGASASATLTTTIKSWDFEFIKTRILRQRRLQASPSDRLFALRRFQKALRWKQGSRRSAIAPPSIRQTCQTGGRVVFSARYSQISFCIENPVKKTNHFRLHCNLVAILVLFSGELGSLVDAQTAPTGKPTRAATTT